MNLENYPQEEKNQISLIFSWKKNNKNQKSFFWQLVAGILGLTIGAYLFFQKNFWGAMTVVLAILTILILQSKNKEAECQILNKGIKINQDFYPWKNLKSFGIKEDLEELFIFTRGKLITTISVPINKKDILKIKGILKNYLPEKEVELSLGDIIARKIGL